MSSEPPAKPVPDAPPEATFDWQHSGFEAFLERHFKKILLVLALVAIGVAGWLVWRQQRQEALAEQAMAFTSAETLEEHRKVIEKYPGTVAAGSAQLMVANLLPEPRDSVEALEEFLAKYPEHPLRDHAAFRAAVLTAEKIDAAQGLEKLEAFISSYPNSELRPLARLRRGDVLIGLGRREDAQAAYDELLKDQSFAGHPLYRQVEARLAQSKLKPPVEVEFVPEPEPSPEAPNLNPNIPGFNIDSLLQQTPQSPPAAPEGAPLEIEVPPPAPEGAPAPLEPESAPAPEGQPEAAPSPAPPAQPAADSPAEGAATVEPPVTEAPAAEGEGAATEN